MGEVLKPAIALWRFAESGKSSPYRELRRHLEEMETSSNPDRRRYDVKVAITGKESIPLVEWLDRHLTFRTGRLSTLVLQLAHAVKAAAHLAPRPDGWMEPIIGFPGKATTIQLTRHWRALAERRSGTILSMEADRVALDYGRHGRFEIEYRMLPRIAVLSDLMLSADLSDAARPVMAILNAIATGPDEMPFVEKQCRLLQQELYRWLDEHQRSRSEQAKFRQIVDFLAARSNDGDIVFDDRAILAYWSRAAQQPDLYKDSRSFEGVLRMNSVALLSFHDAELMTKVETSGSIGADREQDEVDPGEHDPGHDPDEPQEPGDAIHGAWQSPLPRFTEPPLSETGILNPTECSRLDLVMFLGPTAIPLVRSLLRAEVMGAVQLRLSQAKRSKSDNQQLLSLAVLDAPAESGSPPRGYRAVLAMYREMAAQVVKMRMALGHLRRRSIDGELTVEDEALMRAALKKAEAVFNRIERRGFGRLRVVLLEAEKEEIEEALSPFLAGADLLEKVAGQLARVIAAIELLDREVGLEVCLADDREVFAETFARLYGERT